MHVGVEEAVAEHLGEEDLDAGARQLLEVDARRAHALDLRRSGCRACAPSPSPRCVHQSQWTSGTASSGESAKLRRNCEQLAASRIRSSSSCRCLANSATTSRGFRRLPSAHRRSSRPARASSSAMSWSMTRRDAGPQDLDRDFAAIGQGREMHLGHRGRGDRLARRRSANTSCDRLAVGLSPASAMACAEGNGGTWSCSLASSSAMSGGSRSRRVDSTWPNLTKIGPSASSARRRRTARGVRQVAPEEQAGRRPAREAGCPGRGRASVGRGRGRGRRGGSWRGGIGARWRTGDCGNGRLCPVSAASRKGPGQGRRPL